ncbi:MAG: thioesterase family protein [Candidatus Binatia bacterium]|nr:thioesterase family protein [Candidatus Binatia bacterium]
MNFLEMMRLEAHGPDTFVAHGPDYPWGGLYGGQIVAQALRAAGETVDPGFEVHSLHAYFIRLGDSKQPIRFEVDRIRNGRSFATRSVVARQANGAILNLSASFQLSHETPKDYEQLSIPDVAGPDSVANTSWTQLFERRDVERADSLRIWMRICDDLSDADPLVQACALAYLSDDLPCVSVMVRHPSFKGFESEEDMLWNASLDHAIWFHRPVRADEFQLHSFECRSLIGSHGMALGSIFDREGQLVATVSQEVLIRDRRS